MRCPRRNTRKVLWEAMYKRHLLLAGVEVCLRKGYVEKAHAADYLKIKRFKHAEIQDGLGRVGGCWSFFKDISSRANKQQQQQKQRMCQCTFSLGQKKKENTFLRRKIDNGEKAIPG